MGDVGTGDHREIDVRDLGQGVLRRDEESNTWMVGESLSAAFLVGRDDAGYAQTGRRRDQRGMKDATGKAVAEQQDSEIGGHVPIQPVG